MSTIDVGLSPDEALHRVPEFLRGLREGKISLAEAQLDESSIDVLHAACRLLAEPNARGVEEPLDSARALYDFIEKVTWTGPDFDERAELLAACAFAGWRLARRHPKPPVTDEWQNRLHVATPKTFILCSGSSADSASLDGTSISPQGKTDSNKSEEGKDAAVRALATPVDERMGHESDFFLDDPETLLPLLDGLRELCESNPSRVLEESSHLYGFLQRLTPRYPMDLFLLDEREYFLGEAARLAGRVSRELSLRDEARHWLDLAEGWFLQTENASGNLAKVAYQRLALRTEERDFGPVLELLPQLIATFEKLGMTEDALKARFLRAVVFKETDKLHDAVDAFCAVTTAANEKHKALVGWAYVNLVQIHGILGETQKAVALASEATPILQSLGNRIGIAKLQWGVGYLLSSKKEFAGAIKAFRAAQGEFADLGMRADVAAVQLIIADLLLDTAQEKQAEWEIRQALPLIDEYKLVPEGFAAMTLLRESLRRQKIDRQALRNLHVYFEERKS